MMHSNLCAAYPKYVELESGRKVRIRADVHTALLCIDALSDPALEEADKMELVLALFLPFFTRIASRFWSGKKRGAVLRAVLKQHLARGEEQKTEREKKVLDIGQDAPLIWAAFLQCYGVDLKTDARKIHWWEYQDLLASLPDDTRIMQIVSIRARPLPRPTKYNAEERASLIKLKQKYKIRRSEEDEMKQLADGFKAMARRLIHDAQRPS